MVTPQLLVTSALFADLSEECLARFAEVAEEVSCLAGNMLFREGEEASRLYVLLSGRITIQVQPIGLAHPFTIVSLAMPGELVGWSGFMPPSYYTASAVCQEDCRLLAFDGLGFNAIMNLHPASGLIIMRRIAGVISQRLRMIQSGVLKHIYHHDEQ